MSFFVVQYQRFLKIANILKFLGYNSITYRTIVFLAKYFSPYRLYLPVIQHNMYQVLKLPNNELVKQGQLYVKQQGIFCFNAFFIKDISLQWVEDHIHIKNPTLYEQLLKNINGGLILSYHHHFQHLIATVLGLYTNKLSFVAMSPESSPFYTQLKPYIDYLHKNTQKYFGKGKYIFIDELSSKRVVYEEIIQSLANNEFVFSLHDNFISPSVKTYNIHFFDKSINVLAGTVNIALKMEKKIYCCSLEWTGSDKFEFDMIEINHQNVEKVLESYFKFLEHKIQKNPAFWEGWQWFHN